MENDNIDPMQPRKENMRYRTKDLITGEERVVVTGPEKRHVSEDGVVSFVSQMISMTDTEGNELDPTKMPPIGYDETYVLTIMENGRATLVPSYHYPVRGRGSNGVVNVINGKVAATLTCTLRDEVVVAGNRATMLRARVSEIRRTARNAPGIRLISLREGEIVVSGSIVAE